MHLLNSRFYVVVQSREYWRRVHTQIAPDIRPFWLTRQTTAEKQDAHDVRVCHCALWRTTRMRNSTESGDFVQKSANQRIRLRPSFAGLWGVFIVRRSVAPPDENNRYEWKQSTVRVPAGHKAEQFVICCSSVATATSGRWLLSISIINSVYIYTVYSERLMYSLDSCRCSTAVNMDCAFTTNEAMTFCIFCC